MLSDSVFSTMSPEDQQVPKSKIKKIIFVVLKEKEIEGNAFFGDQLII